MHRRAVRTTVAFLAAFGAACGGTVLTVSDGDSGSNGAIAAVSDASVVDGASGSDGGKSTDGGRLIDAGRYYCPKGSGGSVGVLPQFAACSQSSDCRMVALGCYCGNQRIEGVSVTYEKAALDCEQRHSGDAGGNPPQGCSLTIGCFTGTEFRAQDDRTAPAESDVKVHCIVPPNGGAGTCETYVP